MSELDKPSLGSESNTSAQPTEEGSPMWIVGITIFLLVALIAWYRFK